MEGINQKEYLKKYLGIGKMPGEKKKKKKINKGVSDRVKIIDDDAETNTTNVISIEDDLQANEDAPQIVAIIDERPPSLRVDDKTKNPLWQPIGSVDAAKVSEQKQTIAGFKIASKSNDKQLIHAIDRSLSKKKNETLSSKKTKYNDSSPLRKKTVFHDDSPNRKYSNDVPSSQKSTTSNDSSPPRKSRKDGWSPKRISADENSPPSIRDVDSSPPRKSRGDGDISPQRKSRSYDISPTRKTSVKDDISPPRRRPHSDDNSPPRRPKENDISPPRKRRRSSDHSSPSKGRYSKRSASNSPPRKHERPKVRKRDKSLEKRSKKMDKTLDGKTAGLQKAQQLVEETEQLRQRDDQLFKSLSKEQTGENAEPVFRKSGKIRNKAEEEERERKKLEEEKKNKEKYSRWGRGLVQVENRDQQIQQELYEMSKPLARYADDEDLERFLKEQEREGDPMLQYIRNKKRKKAAETGIATKPQFEGNFMPNRFGIKPGHRWDGVDRSNGYEKRYFEAQNAKKALQEDVYKWNTEDM